MSGFPSAAANSAGKYTEVIPVALIDGSGAFAGGATSTNGSTTITAGGTAQDLYAAASRSYVVIANPDATEDLWFAVNAVTAVVNGTGSFRLSPGQSANISGPEASTAISVIAATTGHKISSYKVV